MAMLILLNGTPATGKSTLARAWVERHPLALALDVDRVRSMLGGWRDAPLPAGLVARELALAMIRTHLDAGYDVVVPQYLSRAQFADELEAVAGSAGARFVEVVVRTDPDEAERRFAERAAVGADDDIHGAFVGTSMREVVERHAAFVATRSRAVVVEPRHGEQYVTVDALEAAVRRGDAAGDAASDA